MPRARSLLQPFRRRWRLATRPSTLKIKLNAKVKELASVREEASTQLEEWSIPTPRATTLQKELDKKTQELADVKDELEAKMEALATIDGRQRLTASQDCKTSWRNMRLLMMF